MTKAAGTKATGTKARVAAIALGSNRGDSLETLRKAARDLTHLGNLVRRSSLYRTEPVGGPEGQDAFLNAVVLLNPNNDLFKPERLLDALLTIEKTHGRERRVRWGPRTLDLDLLLIGTKIFESPKLTLPHPRMLERPFVLAPLCEVWPEFHHPISEQSACEILAKLSLTGVVKTELSW